MRYTIFVILIIITCFYSLFLNPWIFTTWEYLKTRNKYVLWNAYLPNVFRYLVEISAILVFFGLNLVAMATALASLTTVSYTHLTLPTKRIV